MAVGQPFYYVASVWSFGAASTVSAARYLVAPGATPTTTEQAVVANRAGTLRNLRWSCESSSLLGIGSRITLYVNGAATPLQAKWDGSATTGLTTSALVPIQVGDRFSMRIQPVGPGSIMRPRVSVELEMPSAIPWLTDGTDMFYNGSGSVGIGTDSPGKKLAVNGSIHLMAGAIKFPDGTDQSTAFPGLESLIPPGSVIAFAGASVPDRWLLCDGSLVGRAEFPELFSAIGSAHGGGDGSTTFRLPDYRGFFLRGVSGSSGMDPDADTRGSWSAPGVPGVPGNAGNAVGSIQDQQTLSHKHALGTGGADSFSMVLKFSPENTSRLAHFLGDAYNTPELHSTGVAGGQETRPSNAYVNFLIKF